MTEGQKKALIAIEKIVTNAKTKKTIDKFLDLAETEGLTSGSVEFFIQVIENHRNQVIHPDMHIMTLQNTIEKVVQNKSVGMSQLYFMAMLVAENPKLKTPTDIIARSSKFFNVNILERGRHRQLATARQMVMKRLNEFGMGATEIGRCLNLDHATVLHGIKAINEKIRIEEVTRNKWLRYISTN